MTQERTSADEAKRVTEVKMSGSAPSIIVVDFGKRQKRKPVKNLRKGTGKLMGRIEDLVEELIEAKTIDKSAQPIVVVVREKGKRRGYWPFAF